LRKKPTQHEISISNFNSNFAQIPIPFRLPIPTKEFIPARHKHPSLIRSRHFFGRKPSQMRFDFQNQHQPIINQDQNLPESTNFVQFSTASDLFQFPGQFIDYSICTHKITPDLPYLHHNHIIPRDTAHVYPQKNPK